MGFCAINSHYGNRKLIGQVFNGTCRVASMNADGQNFIDDVGPGDLWYFPQGNPHSIQALGNGCSFLLVFDNG